MIGIDLGKVVFQIHGVNDRGKTALHKQLRRNKKTKFFANQEPCLIGMKSYSSIHHIFVTVLRWIPKERATLYQLTGLRFVQF
jgi:transposase